jgi:hypothetical protein
MLQLRTLVTDQAVHGPAVHPVNGSDLHHDCCTTDFHTAAMPHVAPWCIPVCDLLNNLSVWVARNLSRANYVSHCTEAPTTRATD